MTSYYSRRCWSFFVWMVAFGLGASGSGETGARLTQKLMKEGQENVRDRQESIIPGEFVVPTPARFRFPPSQDRKTARIAQDENRLDQEIFQAEKRLAEEPHCSSRANLLFRLAQLRYEKSRIVHYREMQQYDRNVENWLRLSRENTGALEPKMDDRQSQAFAQKSISAYRMLLKRHKDFERRDEVLFNLGYILNESNLVDEGIRQYRNLIQAFPKSRFTPMAYLAMGELYFELADFVKARKTYQSVQRFLESEAYAFALYKLAWCHHRLGRDKKALEALKQVVELETSNYTAAYESGSEASSLKNRVLQDMVWIFSKLGALDEAGEYYQEQVGSEPAKRYILSLAGAYIHQHQPRLTVRVLRRFLNEYPEDPHCPRVHQKILGIYLELNQREQVLREINRLVEQYKPDSRWADANRENRQVVRQASVMIENSIRKLAKEAHQEAQKTKRWESFDLARRIYEKYLEVFEDSENAYQFGWLLAGIQYRMGDFHAAAEQYTKLIKMAERGSLSSASAYHALLSWSNCIELRDKKGIDCRNYNPRTIKRRYVYEETRTVYMTKYTALPAKKKQSVLLERRPIHDFEKQLLRASEAYFRLSSQHEMEFAVRYQIALVLYKHGYYEQMAKQAEYLVENFPKEQRTVAVVGLSLQSLFDKASLKQLDDHRRRDAWAVLNLWSKRFGSKQDFITASHVTKKRLDRDIKLFMEKSEFELLMAERMQKPVKAAMGMKSFVKKFATSKYAPRALYEAMVIFDRVGRLNQAIEAGKLLVSQYPQSDTRGPAAILLAKVYTRVANLVRVAAINEIVFETYLDKKPKSRRNPAYMISEPEAKLALIQAGRFRELYGDFSKALKNYGKFVKHFPDDQKAVDMLFKIGQIREQQGQWRMADRYYQGILAKYGRRLSSARLLEANYHHGMALCKLGKRQKCHAVLTETVEEYDRLAGGARSGRVRNATAHARFVLLEPEFDEYVKIELRLPAKQLKKNMLKKINLRIELESKYGKIMAYKAEHWTVAAMVRMGQLSQHLSQSLYEAPAPGGLGTAQKDMYKEELEKQALPLEEKAINFFRRAIEVSFSKNLYNQWTLKAQDSIRAYQPNAYPAPYESELISSPHLYSKGPDLDVRATGSGVGAALIEWPGFD